MPCSLLQSDCGAFTHMIMMSTFDPKSTGLFSPSAAALGGGGEAFPPPM